MRSHAQHCELSKIRVGLRSTFVDSGNRFDDTFIWRLSRIYYTDDTFIWRLWGIYYIRELGLCEKPQIWNVVFVSKSIHLHLKSNAALPRSTGRMIVASAVEELQESLDDAWIVFREVYNASSCFLTKDLAVTSRRNQSASSLAIHVVRGSYY